MRCARGSPFLTTNVARTLGVPDDRFIPVSDAGLNRPVRFVARKSMFAQPLVQNFYRSVSELAGSV